MLFFVSHNCIFLSTRMPLSTAYIGIRAHAKKDKNYGYEMGKQTVLIVEDEADIRELLSYNLPKEGFATLEAGDGRVGLEMARAKMPAFILRIRNILKRQLKAASGSHISLHGVELNQSAHKVLVQGESVDLTATEFRLLENFMRHAGQVLTREQLSDSVWGYQFDGYRAACRV